MRRWLSLWVTLLLALTISPSVFALEAPKDPSFVGWVKGKIVVEFSLPPGQIQMKSGPFATATLGISSLDAISEKHGVSSIAPMFPGAVPKTYQGQVIDLRNYYIVKFPETVDLDAILNDYRKDANVKSVEADATYSADANPNDPLFVNQWQHYQASDHDIDTPEAWNIETGSPNIIVAILDSGIKYWHKDLGGANASNDYPENARGNMWINEAELNGDSAVDDDGNGWVDDWIGWNFIDDNNSVGPQGGSSHGTNCAGVVAALGNDGYGVAGVAGGWHDDSLPVVGNGVRIMAITAGINGGISNTASAQGFFYAAQNGANIANWSRNNPYGTVCQVMLYFMASGGLICKSAGNSGAHADDWADIRTDIISVGATNALDELADFSNYGNDVEIAAPGVGVWTTGAAYSDNWGGVSGTSFSSPMVAGVAALIWSRNPEWSADQVRSRLLNTADNVGINVQGGRRVNAYRAVGEGDCENESSIIAVGVGGVHKAYGVSEGAEGRILIAGIDSAASPSTVVDCYAACFDSCGTFLWNGSYGDTLPDGSNVYAEMGRAVAPDQNKGFLIAGVSRVDQTSVYPLYIKADSIGNQVVLQRLYQPGYYGEFNAVVQSADGGHLLAGYTQAVGGQKDMYIVKTAPGAVGDTVWSRAIGDSLLDECAYAIKTCSDGGYLIGGAKENAQSIFDACLIKIDSSGNTVWTKTYSDSSRSIAVKVVREKLYGGYLLLANTLSEVPAEYQSAVVHADAGGDSVRSYVLASGTTTFINGLETTDDGGYLVGMTAYYSGVHSVWYFKYSPLDEVVGYHSLVPNSTNRDDHLLAMEKTSMGGYAGAGYRTVNITYNDDTIFTTQAALMKSKPDGELGKIIVEVPQDFPTIQQAVDFAWPGWQVLVDSGTYTGSGNRDIDFGGKNIEVVSKYGPGKTIIDCQDQARAFYFDSGEDSTAIVSGFTIANGNEMSYALLPRGGGIYIGILELPGDPGLIIPCSPSIRNCIFRDCRAEYGGGIYVPMGSTSVIENCTFVRDSAHYGGAIAMERGSNIKVNSSIIAFCEGAGMYNLGPTGTLSYECNVFYGNTGGTSVGISNAGTNNKTADPQFCDYQANDFKVFVYSPCGKYYNLCQQEIGAFQGYCDTPYANHGDVDLNATPYEQADIQLLRDWFDHGDAAFVVDDSLQRMATDANCDGFMVTTADYVILKRILAETWTIGCPDQEAIINKSDTIHVRDTSFSKGATWAGVTVELKNDESMDDFQIRLTYDTRVLTPCPDTVDGHTDRVQFQWLGNRQYNMYGDSSVVIRTTGNPGEILIYVVSSTTYPSGGYLQAGSGPILRIFFNVSSTTTRSYTYVTPVDNGYNINQLSNDVEYGGQYYPRAIMPTLKAGLILLSTPSCPVLFAYDGKGYVQENPLLTACEENGYQTAVTDYYHVTTPLVPENGQVKFQLREMEDEYTYLEGISLLEVDHPAGTKALCAVDGTIRTFDRTVAPISAVDDLGVDRLAELAAEDGQLFAAVKSGYIDLTFPRTEGGAGYELISTRKNQCEVPIPETLFVAGGPDDGSGGGFQEDIPSVAELTVAYKEGAGTWGKAAVVPSRVAQTREIVYLEDAPGNASTVTIRVSWTGSYSTDAVRQLLPSAEIPSIRERMTATAAFKPAVGSALQKPGFGKDRPLEMRKGDLFEFAFEVGPAVQNTTRDYFIKASGRYIPAYLVGASARPTTYALRANYPNPFNPTTTISYDLPKATQVKLQVFNVLGQHVATLVDELQETGSHTVVWDGKDANGYHVASGIYLYRLTAGEFTDTRKMVLLK